MQVSERNLSIPEGLICWGSEILFDLPKDRWQNTSYLVGKKASVKVRDEVVKLGNIVERLLGVKWK